MSDDVAKQNTQMRKTIVNERTVQSDESCLGLLSSHFPTTHSAWGQRGCAEGREQ